MSKKEKKKKDKEENKHNTASQVAGCTVGVLESIPLSVFVGFHEMNKWEKKHPHPNPLHVLAWLLILPASILAAPVVGGALGKNAGFKKSPKAVIKGLFENTIFSRNHFRREHAKVEKYYQNEKGEWHTMKR